MKYKKLVQDYLKYLEDIGYSKNGIMRKRIILKNYVSYALSLYHHGAIKIITNTKEPILYKRDRIYITKNKEKIEYIHDFLKDICSAMSVARYLNFDAFLTEYLTKYSADSSKNTNRFNTIFDFCKAAGHELEIDKIPEKVYLQCISYLKSQNNARVVRCARDIFIFCFDNDIIHFNPYEYAVSPYKRTFQEDFIGGQDTFWIKRLREYIHFIKFERNLSDGGIDYQVRKLKIVILWLNSKQIKKIDANIVKDFIADKKAEGIKNITLSKYRYQIKYFCEFLIHKGFLTDNPANDLKIKYQAPAEGDILSEPEINSVIENFENIIYNTRNPGTINETDIHFRAIRDRCLFTFFTFLGLRLSAAVAIKISDINFNKKSIKIKSKGNKSYNKKERELLLTDYLWQSLVSYLKVRNCQGQKYLWITLKGVPLQLSGINRIIHVRIKEAGIDKKISPHRLRATCASYYLKKGMDPFTLKSLLGHNSIATTIDEYTKYTEEELRAVWKKTNPLRGLDE